MAEIDSLVQTVLEYYNSNNLKIPNSVVEYMGNYPKGYSRQVLLSKYGLKCSDFIKMLNPSYSKPLRARERAQVEASRLGYDIVSSLDSLNSNRDTVDLRCQRCGHTHSTTVTSLQGSKLGCLKCKSGNLPWSARGDELSELVLDRLDSVILSDIPPNQTGYITIKHNLCGTEYTTQLVGIVSPNSKNRATCPNCRTTDRRVVYDDITFGSEFEKQCYIKLKHLNPELHVPYSKYLSTARRWVCDFKIGNYWIEVSNFKADYKGYFANIEHKKDLVESSNHHFFFITSLKEIDELVSLM